MTTNAIAAVEQNVPVSQTSRIHSVETLSKRLWDLEWSEHLPWNFDGISVEPGTFEDALPFMQEHYADIFGVHSDRFSRRNNDGGEAPSTGRRSIIFRAGAETVGISAGHPSDWSSYYIRTFAILPHTVSVALLPSSTTRLAIR